MVVLVFEQFVREIVTNRISADSIFGKFIVKSTSTGSSSIITEFISELVTWESQDFKISSRIVVADISELRQVFLGSCFVKIGDVHNKDGFSSSTEVVQRYGWSSGSVAFFVLSDLNVEEVFATSELSRLGWRTWVVHDWGARVARVPNLSGLGLGLRVDPLNNWWVAWVAWVALHRIFFLYF